MTVALGIAMNAGPTGSALAVVADSRLTVGPTSTVDTFVKAMELGPQSVVLVAGDSTLPATVAAEVSRPLLRAMRANALKDGRPRPSLLEEVRQFVTAYALVHRSLPNITTETIAAGYFSDGSAGLILTRMRAKTVEMRIWRPVGPGDAVIVGVGSSSTVGLAVDAVRLHPPKHLDEAIARMASVVWETIRSNLDPGIGGGLLVGYSIGMQEWVWPPTVIGKEWFYRGFPIDAVSAPVPYNLAFEPELRERVERERPNEGYPQWAPAPMLVSTGIAGAPSVTDGTIPSEWELSASERGILGVS
jgi:hypothetical protein